MLIWRDPKEKAPLKEKGALGWDGIRNTDLHRTEMSQIR